MAVYPAQRVVVVKESPAWPQRGLLEFVVLKPVLRLTTLTFYVEQRPSGRTQLANTLFPSHFIHDDEEATKRAPRGSV